METFTEVYNSNWTEEEIEYINAKLGLKTVEEIAEKLNRTLEATLKKISLLGLSIDICRGEWITLHQLAQIINIPYRTVCNWEKTYALPVQSLKFRKNTKPTKSIKIEKFWSWAENHRGKIKWHEVEEKVLMPEPNWLKEERRNPTYAEPANKKWVVSEDEYLWDAYYEQAISLKDIALHLNRSYSAVEKRIKRLRDKGFALSKHNKTDVVLKTSNIKKTSKKWTDEDHELLWRGFYKEKLGYKELAKLLGRTVISVEKRLQKLREQKFKLKGVKSSVGSKKRVTIPWSLEEDLRLWEYRKIMNLDFKVIDELMTERSLVALQKRITTLSNNNFEDDYKNHLANQVPGELLKAI